MIIMSEATPNEGHETISDQVEPCLLDGQEIGRIAVQAIRCPDDSRCEIVINHSIQSGTVALHWGVTYSPDGPWACPPARLWPGETEKVDDTAATTRMAIGGPPVRLVVPRDSDIFDVKFVLRRTMPGADLQWLKRAAGDFRVVCRGADGQAARARILHDEGQAWSGIYRRFCMVMDLLDAAQTDEEVMAWVYVVLRLHYGKQLRWYGDFNYQSKDIAHLQDTLSRRMALAACYAPNPRSRRLARMAMAFLSRGGGMSEQIRLQILDMMRRHGIKEGHRPGIEDRFLEQWHQKLHQSSTPEDVAICEAYLHFLHTGRDGDFWHALWTNGGISRERLARMPNPITASPLHLPQLIPDLQRYLWTLKTVHAGADLGFMIESGKWALEQLGDHEAVGWLYDIGKNFGAWWVPGKIAQARARLVGPLSKVFAAERDVLLLDAALDAAFKTAVERIDLGSLSGDSLVDLVDLVASQAALSANQDGEQQSCLEQWRRHVKNGPRWSWSWALRAMAAAERMSLLLQQEAHTLSEQLQGKAEQLARTAAIPDGHVTHFAEEVIRGQSSYPLSLLLQRLRPMLRQTIGRESWTVLSLPADGRTAVGRLHFLPSLATAQPPRFEQPAVLIVDEIDGVDDVVDGTRAVLAAGSLDVLSHFAIRARNQGVLLACCDGDQLAEVRRGLREGDFVSVRLRSDDVEGGLIIAQADAPDFAPGPLPRATPARLARPQPWRGPIVDSDSFAPGVVGAKAINLAELADRLPSWLAVPRMLALPFGTMEAVLALPANASVASVVEAQAVSARRAFLAGDAPAMSTALDTLRVSLASGLAPDAPLESALLRILGILTQPASCLRPLWNAVRRVWASKWTDRAFLSRARAGLPDAELSMSVLVQALVGADYAFVLHTANPLTMDRDAVWGEVVVGLGDTLVGSFPGRAFRFAAARGPTPDLRILAYPSKPAALVAEPSPPGLIARSDSNGEDLPELAGAGLYDSVACATIRTVPVDYTTSPLFGDDGFQRSLMDLLRQVGLEVEQSMGGKPQDVEGVIREGRVTIVQARPQVGSVRASHAARPD